MSCDEQPPTPAGGVRDSAGVRIVDVSFAEAAPWTLAPEPVLDLSAPGIPSGEFFHVTGAALLADGAVAVLNAGTHQVRVFGADGTLEAEFGRAGDGPGEFRMPYGLFEVLGVGVFVHDPERSALSGFDRAGRLVLTTSVRHLAAWPLVAGWIEGDLVLLGVWTELPVPGEVRTQYMQYHALSWTTGAADTLGRIPSGTISFIGGLEPWGVIGPGLLESQALGVTAEGLAVLGDGGVAELRAVDGQGVLRSVLRWHEAPRAVRNEDAAAAQRARLEEFADPTDRAMMRKQLAATPVADRFPIFDTLMADRDGRIWIRAYAEFGAARHRWHVVRLDGSLVAALEMPVVVTPFDAAGDRVLVVERDDTDMELVRVYRIQGNAAGSRE